MTKESADHADGLVRVIRHTIDGVYVLDAPAANYTLESAIDDAVARGYQAGQDAMRNDAAEVAQEWLSRFSDQEVVVISARSYASNSIADILDGIRAIPSRIWP